MVQGIKAHEYRWWINTYNGDLPHLVCVQCPDVLSQPVVSACDAAREVPCVEGKANEDEVVIQADDLALEAEPGEDAQGDEDEGQDEEDDAYGVVLGGARLGQVEAGRRVREVVNRHGEKEQWDDERGLLDRCAIVGIARN